MSGQGIERERALTRLREADQAIEAVSVSQVASLAPDRDRATPLAELGQTLAARLDADDAIDAHAAPLFLVKLAELGLAIAEHFPENIYWDLDYLAAAVVDEARRTARQARTSASDAIDASFTIQVRLMRLFGRHEAIQFRYVHDYTFGFDWCRWILKQRDAAAEGDADAAATLDVGPFDRPFLEYLDRRGHEILQLIAEDDETYPKLPDGTPRNPFAFPREPAEERRLHETLAARRQIPVEVWRIDAEPRADRPYHEIRAETAATSPD